MDKYGSDKPDLRISLLVQDATEVLADCGFGPFEGKTVKAIVAPEFKGTRKVIDKLCADVEVQSGQKAYWFRLDEKMELVGGISKFLQDKKDAVVAALGLKAGDFIHTIGDAHIYLNHLEQVDLQLTRSPRPLPQMLLNPDVKNIFDFKYEDFELVNYDPWPHIAGKVSV